MTRALTIVPTTAAVQALTRSQLEAAVIDGAIARVKLEQRVIALEAELAERESASSKESGGASGAQKPTKNGKR